MVNPTPYRDRPISRDRISKVRGGAVGYVVIARAATSKAVAGPKIKATAQRPRRSRTAAGVTAGRIQRAGSSLRAGHLRRAHATIRSASWVSIAALIRVRIP
jgi:hypothetical protein